MDDCDKSSEGSIYCITHPDMPGRVKIGMTERTPEERCADANRSTWSLPMFKIEFAKYVKDRFFEEKRIHTFFSKERIHPRREWFDVPLEKVKMLFDIIDGTDWDPNLVNASDGESDHLVNGESDGECEEGCTMGTGVGIGGEGIGPKGNRTKDAMRSCFKEGQKIRHVIGKNGGEVWYGIYQNNKIVRDGIQYSSLSTFAKEHHASIGSSCAGGNGWMVCDCEIQSGQWILANDAFLAAIGSSSSSE
jgi:T5orf172 domain